MKTLKHIIQCKQKNNSNLKKGFMFLIFLLLVLGIGTKNVSAQTSTPSPSVLYVPLIGITSVPSLLSLPSVGGYITYNYAVKNFLPEVPLTNIQVVDDKCESVKFVGGDDNGNTQLDSSETWRYSCTAKLSQTTESVATATGTANSISATHKAYTTVVVGANNPAPLVSIVNVTKVAYPLSLPSGGGRITFTYRVNNPGVAPLSNVIVTDDKCSALSGRLGDTNGNNLLDTNEVWIYNCTTTLQQTTTNTVHVSGTANGFRAFDEATITVNVATASQSAEASTRFPDAGVKPEGGVNPSLKITVWTILAAVLGAMSIFLVASRKKALAKTQVAHHSVEGDKKA